MDIEKNQELLIRDTKLPTLKQLERSIYQQFSSLYREKTGAALQKASCSIFKTYLIIVAEQALSPLEATLKSSGELELLKEMRFSVERIIESELKNLIKEIAGVDTIDLICGLNLNSGRIIATAILFEFPKVRAKK